MFVNIAYILIENKMKIVFFFLGILIEWKENPQNITNGLAKQKKTKKQSKWIFKIKEGI